MENGVLFPFFVWPKPKIPFVGLSLLRNQTETLATQAKQHIMSLVSSQFSEAGTDRLVCACNSSIYLVQHFMAASGPCLAFVSYIFPTNLHPFIFLLKLVKQVPGYVGIGAHGSEMQIYQLLWHYCM